MLDLFEFEAVPDDGGGAAPEALADPIVPAEPVAAEPPAPVEEPVAEPEAWAGPSREEWEATQAQLAEAAQVADIIRQAQYQPADQPADELPEYDPYDPEAAAAYFEARDQRLERRIEGLLSPILEKEHNAQAQ